MTRKGIPGGCDKKCSPWCAIKEKLDTLWDRTHNAFTSLNGVEGDGTGNLQIEAGENISLEQSGNRIRITGEGGGVEYSARSPLDIYENEIFARMGPVEAGKTWLVHADNINTQINDAVSSEATARAAADDALGDRIDDLEDGTVSVGRAISAGTADTAGTADALSGVLPQANGGTGGTSLKTINGESIVGSGDISTSAPISFSQNYFGSSFTFSTTSYRNITMTIPLPSTLTADRYLCICTIKIYCSNLPEDNIITVSMTNYNTTSANPIYKSQFLKDRDNSDGNTHIILTTAGVMNTETYGHRITTSLTTQPTATCSAIAGIYCTFIPLA